MKGSFVNKIIFIFFRRKEKMKKTKVISLLAVSVLSVSLLAACGSNNDSSKNTSDSAKPAQTADTFTGATTPNANFDGLSKTMSKTGNWLGAIGGDMDASGKTLTVDGLFSGDGALARKLALYNQDANHVVTARYTLTVAKVEVNSPGFYISNGTVKGDVVVNAPGFHAQNGKGIAGQATIDGNLIFASQSLMDAYNKAIATDPTQAVKVTGATKVEAGTVVTVDKGAIKVGTHGAITYVNKGTGSDVATGATAGTTDIDTLTKGLSANGAWINALKGDLDASGKTITVDGTFMTADNTIGRKLALYNQDANHVVTARYTLTVAKLIVNSPSFYISNGIVKGDVYVGADATNFFGQSGKDAAGVVTPEIQGNLYFATAKQLAAFKALPAAQQVKVSGEVAVKAAN
jgi:hypothetical protein